MNRPTVNAPDPGPALSPELQRELAQLRSQTGPAPEARHRMWAALAVSATPELDPDPDPDPDPSLDPSLDPGLDPATASALPHAAKILAATASMTAAGLLALRLGVLGVRAVAPTEPTTEPVTEPAIKSVESAARHPDSAKPEAKNPGTEDTALPPPQPTPPFDGQTKAEPLAPARTAPSTLPAQADGSLGAELELIQRARSADDAGAALSLLAQHRARFAHGQLADERELLIVERACATRPADAQAAADVLIEGARLSHARIRDACPSLERPQPTAALTQ